MNPISIRPAERADCPAILEIYNDAVLHTTASYDEEPGTLEQRRQWFDAHRDQGLAMFVAELENPGGGAEIVGWSSLSRFRERVGYRFTVENSVYVAERWRGRGVGSLLLPPLITSAEQGGFHAIIAAIDASNDASIRLHAGFGFERVGHFREVGFKFGRWLDVVYMERRTGTTAPIPAGS